ncbi:MAG: 1-acyl-sn-glycerol-3-phosphate acyltransferase [Halieaceae bacterium]|jgi:hypothetical protein|nr:1-acyl-sn-glycerol-3-phosphate acyltransferase [Halieaceae bacterium]
MTTDNPTTDDPFADIRPYNNAEAPEVFARLGADPELVDSLARLRLPRLLRWAPPLARSLVRRWLAGQVASLKTVEDLQLSIVKPELEKVIAKTTTFTTSGLEKLDAASSWLFISNHRDIVMDPALANYALHRAGHRTLSIAIGNNLLQKPWVADLMRLNKSFIVRRDVQGPRELLAASRQLSAYIRHMISDDVGPVWLAQREGRAKDGRDATEPAVIKMLSLSRDKRTESVGETLAALKIVPLAISYEVDPCDTLKAAELAAGPDYRKRPFEDVASIGKGISGYKGCVHLAFGEPIVDPDLDVDGVVAAIDQQISTLYALFPTNLWAWEMLHGEAPPASLPVRLGVVQRHTFEERIRECPESLRPWLLAMYANPVDTALAHRPEVL